MIHTHLHIGRVPIHKHHVRAFLAIAGFTLMGIDWTVAVIHHLHVLEPVAAPGGKLGAFMAGAVPLFEGILKTGRNLA